MTPGSRRSDPANKIYQQKRKKEEKGHARRFVRKGGNVNPNTSGGAKRKYDVPEGKIPSIPGYILYNTKLEDVRKYLIRWRGVYNDEKRTIRIDELQKRIWE